MAELGVAERDRVAFKDDVERVDLVDGRTVVVKRGEPDAIDAEAAGLEWLRVPAGPPLPDVLAIEPLGTVTKLIIGFVPSSPPTSDAAEALGRRLAALHRAGAPAFGAAPPGGPAAARIGRAPMRNRPASHWPAWYAEERVLPYLKSARDAGTITAEQAAPVEKVVERIESLAGPAEFPARLHGDLWSGNVLWAADGAWLIDPAAHGGHRETDLAMLALFGCPYVDVVLAAYDEAAPLAAGWRSRVGLHQLFPLLVHTVLFGSSYVERTVAAARAALRMS